MAKSSKATRKRKSTPSGNPIPLRESSKFERLHFPTTPLAKPFKSRFMGRKVIDSYYVDLEDFKELIVCARSMRDMLLPWESALNLDHQVYPNLVRVFYSNMKISANRLDQIITYVGGVLIEFDVEDLNNILGTPDADHKIIHLGKPSRLLIFLIIVVLEIFVVTEILRVIFVLFLSVHSYCLYK